MLDQTIPLPVWPIILFETILEQQQALDEVARILTGPKLNASRRRRG